MQVEKCCEEILCEVLEKDRLIPREIVFDKNHVHITINAGTKGLMDVSKALKEIPGRKQIFEEMDFGDQQSILTTLVKNN